MIFTYGFSVTGTSHIKRGIDCQDANKIVNINNDIVIVAIADGVGSCKFSDVASKIAVNVLLFSATKPHFE